MPPSILRTAAALASLTAFAGAQTWLQLNPNPFPNATQQRRTGGFAYHPVAGGLVLYGGLQSSPTATLAETWLYDGTTFTQLSPTTAPPPRWGHRMVYDSRRARIVAFGGRSPTTTANANDTWEFDGVDWQQVVTAASPTARAFYGMAYDSRRGRTVMYGAQSGFPNGNQTWEYDGTTWVQVTTPTTPPGVESPALAFDKARGVTVMFGGYNAVSPGTMYDSTWEYDGVDWTQRQIANPPIARYRAGIDYDEVRGRVVLYGGFGNATALQDTWEYDGNTWTQVATGGPTRSTEAFFAYAPNLGSFVHFGGSGPGGTPNETWLYVGAGTAIAAPFGSGCATSVGTPTLAATAAPTLGSSYQLNLAGAPGSSFGVFVTGFSSETWPVGDLPADLTPFGYGGCDLLVSPDASTFAVFANGTGTQTIAVPTSAAFVNIPLFTQVFVLDASAPNGVGGASNAVHGRLGT